MKNTLGLTIITFLLSIVSISAVVAGEPTINHWGQFTFENDAFGVRNTSDDGYTNGVGYAWGQVPISDFSKIDMPNWIHAISGWTYINQEGNGNYAISYGIAQGMFTPTDAEKEAPIDDDRPYAGTLIWQVKLRQYETDIATSIALNLGIVGPAALAEYTQELVHQAISASEYKGWDNQIGNEPIFRIESEYLNRFAAYSFTEKIGIDANLYAQAGLGNLKSNAGVGLTLRIGSELSETYAYINPTASHSANPYAVSNNNFNWQLFISGFGNYVFNDITLDGNTFKDSASIALIHGQGQISIGFALRWGSWGVLFSSLHGTKQFDGQVSDTNFGAASISYHY